MTLLTGVHSYLSEGCEPSMGWGTLLLLYTYKKWRKRYFFLIANINILCINYGYFLSNLERLNQTSSFLTYATVKNSLLELVTNFNLVTIFNWIFFSNMHFLVKLLNSLSVRSFFHWFTTLLNILYLSHTKKGGFRIYLNILTWKNSSPFSLLI